jgi:hypothetical protein
MDTSTRVLGTFAAAAAACALAAGPAIAAGGAIPLNNEQETTGATGGGSGFFTFTTTGGQLCYTLQVRDLTVAPLAAHIHIGPREVAGPIVVGLATPPGATATSSACITAVLGGDLTPAELAAIAGDPKAYYVNVHTTTFPGGEVRGQLKK